MTIDDYFQEIESLPFQIQFSVLSGLKLLLHSLSEHPTVNGLISLANDNPEYIKQIVQRIKALLPIANTETTLSYDESIVTYLYCLSKLDINLAQQASLLTLKENGLWWSSQYALQLENSLKTILKSIDLSANDTGGNEQYMYPDNTLIFDFTGTSQSSYQIESKDDYPTILVKTS